MHVNKITPMLASTQHKRTSPSRNTILVLDQTITLMHKQNEPILYGVRSMHIIALEKSVEYNEFSSIYRHDGIHGQTAEFAAQ
jgi:hypothetical protein